MDVPTLAMLCWGERELRTYRYEDGQQCEGEKCQALRQRMVTVGGEWATGDAWRKK